MRLCRQCLYLVYVFILVVVLCGICFRCLRHFDNTGICRLFTAVFQCLCRSLDCCAALHLFFVVCMFPTFVHDTTRCAVCMVSAWPCSVCMCVLVQLFFGVVS